LKSCNRYKEQIYILTKINLCSYTTVSLFNINQFWDEKYLDDLLTNLATILDIENGLSWNYIMSLNRFLN